MQIESEMLTEIANTLGIAVERIFEIFVEAQPVLAVISAILTILVIYITLYSARYGFNKTKDWDEGVEKTSVRVLGPIMVLLLTWMIADITRGILICLLLPEYAAINELIGLIGI